MFRQLTTRAAAYAVTLVGLLAVVGGCASWQGPRIDPSGERIFIWPNDPQPVVTSPFPPVVTAPGAPVVTGPPVVTSPPAGAPIITTPPPAIPPATGIGAPMGNVQAPPVFSDPTAVPPPAVGTPYAPNVVVPGAMPAAPALPPGAVVPPAAATAVAGAPMAPIVPQTLTAMRPAGVPIMATPIGTCAPRGVQYLRVTPNGIMAPVGSEVVIKAGVSDCDGSLLTNRRVEWGIAGAGQFTELGSRHQVGTFAWPWTLPRRIAANHAISTTATGESTLFSGTPDPNDDVPIFRGEAWVTLTSPCEGTSLVTAFAPSLPNYNRVTVQVFWVDAQFIFPPSTTAEPGRPHVLTTTVLRRSDNAPLAGWTVRYDVAGGASLGYEGGNFVETQTDAAGRASVEVSPVDAGGGTTNVAVSVYRPAVGGGTPPRGLGSNITTITWGGAAQGVVPGVPTAPVTPSMPAPPLASPPVADPYTVSPSLPTNPYSPGTSTPPSSTMPPSSVQPPVGSSSGAGSAQAPDPYSPPPGDAGVGRPQLQVRVGPATPGQVAVGEFVRFDVVITNTGDGTARGIQVRDEFTAGLRHPSAKPGESAIVNTSIQDLPPNESTTVPLTFQVTAEGEQCHTVIVSAQDAETISQRGCVQGIRPAVASFRITGLRSAVVGQTAQFNVSVRNGDVTTPDAQVVLKFDPAIEPTGTLDPSHERLPDGSILLKLGDLARGDLRTFVVEGRCKAQSQNACVQGELSSGGAFLTAAESCVEILPPAPTGDGGIFGP